MVPINEQFADAVRIHAVNLLRVTNSFYRNSILTLLTKMESDLVARLASSNVEGKGGLTDFARRRVQQLIEFSKETIDTAYGKASDANTQHLQDVADLDVQFVQGMINGTVGIDLLTEVPTAAMLEQIVSMTPISGAPSEAWWLRQSKVVQQKFSDIISQGMVQGKTNGELVQSVRGTRENGYKDGILDATRSQAAALVRSSVAAVQNRTRLATLQQNADIFSGMMQVSTLDSRTTIICISYSGATWDMDLNPIGDTTLPFDGGCPRHWGCRSTIVPILKSWDDLGLNLPEFPTSTRASMDGQVPADMTFDEWLKTKSDTFQNDLLGAAKADLWRQGKITLSQLLDSTGKRPLTVAELKAKL